MKRLRLERHEIGAVALMVALLLIAVAALVVDLARLLVVKTELRNVTDACALAAARELNVKTKTLQIFTRAENAGIEVGSRHFTDFQRSQVRFACSIRRDSSIRSLYRAVGTPFASASNVGGRKCDIVIAGMP